MRAAQHTDVGVVVSGVLRGKLAPADVFPREDAAHVKNEPNVATLLIVVLRAMGVLEEHKARRHEPAQR